MSGADDPDSGGLGILVLAVKPLASLHLYCHENHKFSRINCSSVILFIITFRN
jgi:hypothetical protein